MIFTFEDLDTVLNQGRLVTKVIYLEDPDQALPFRMAKDQIPVVSINPAENPLRVAVGAGAADGDRPARRPAAHARGGPGRAGRPRAGLRRQARRRALSRS